MAKTKEYKDRYFWKSGKGYRERKIAHQMIPSISDSSDVWGVDKNTTTKWSLFVAPCDCKVQRCFVNAVTYPHMAHGGTCTVTFKKKGTTDASLTSALSIIGLTDETDTDATISSKTIEEGDIIYAEIAVSNHTVDTAGANVSFEIEYRHTEN